MKVGRGSFPPITIMKCDLTQKVSLLIDGELSLSEAHEVERHLDACDDCQQAQADFLLLRQQITSYQVDSDAFAEHRALKGILAAGGGRRAKFETEESIARPRRQRARFAGVFGMPRVNPVGLAALLLLLVGIAIGVVSLVDMRGAPVEVVEIVPTPPPAPHNNAQDSSTGNTQGAAPLATPNDLTAVANKGEATDAGNQQQQQRASAKSANGATQSVLRGRNLDRAPRRHDESAGNIVPQASPAPILEQPQVATVPVAETAANNNVGAVDDNSGVETGEDAWQHKTEAEEVTATSKTERHVEQAQLLLRSFRNARPADAGTRASSDIAYDKRQSKKLLYQNIVLRREAASRGNLPVESLLDSLEPILIDIANLPDRPALADVREINERMRRKNLVAMLQISSVESASARN